MLIKPPRKQSLHEFFALPLFYTFDQLKEAKDMHYDKIDATGLGSSQKWQFKGRAELVFDRLDTPRKRAAYQAEYLLKEFEKSYTYHIFDFLDVACVDGFTEAFHFNGLETIPPLDVYLNTSSDSLDELAIAFSETAKGFYETKEKQKEKIKHLALTYQIVSSPDLYSVYFSFT